MAQCHPDLDPMALDPALWDQLPGAVTVVDLEGRILMYNDQAPLMLDRKPEYLGRQVGDCHQPANSKRIQEMLAAIAGGREEHFSWRLSREGREYQVRLAPLRRQGRLMGAVHLVVPLDGP